MKFGHFTAGDVASLMHYIRNWTVLTAILDMVAKKRFVFLLEIKPRSAKP
jgi:hypothetical protein